MPTLYRTTKSGVKKKDFHHHFVLVLDESLSQGRDSVVVSSDGTHEHEVDFVSSDIDALSGGPQPALDISMLTLLPALDGHAHNLKPKTAIIPSSDVKIPEEKVETTKARIRTQFYNNSQRERPNQIKGNLHEEFYKGNQWCQLSEKDRKKMSDNNKPMLVFNQIQKYTKLILGYMRQKRTDTKFLPIEESDTLIADILTLLYKLDSSNSNYEIHEIKAIKDSLLSGRGNMLMYVDREDDVRGEIKWKRVRWQQCYYGEHDNDDASDCPQEIMSTWMNEDQIKTLYPKHEKEISQTVDLLRKYDETPLERHDKFDQHFLITPEQGGINSYFDNTKNNYNTIETWERRYISVNTLYSLTDQLDFEYNDTKEYSKEEQVHLNSLGIGAVERRVKYIKHYVLIGADLLVTNEVYSYKTLPLYPYYFDKMGDDQLTFIDSAIDPQLEMNKRLSMVADILNKTPFKMRFFERDMFDNDKQLKLFKENANNPDALFEVKDATRLPVETQGLQLPPAVVAHGDYMGQLGGDLLNINLELQGAKSNVTSGVAIMRRQAQSLMGNENIPDNLYFTKRQMARGYVEMAYDVHDAGRVINILNDNLQKEGFEEGIQLGALQVKGQLSQEEKSYIMERWSQAQAKRSKVDVGITESPYSPTTMMATFLLMVEMVNSGQFPIPPLALLEVMPLPHKEKKMIKELIIADQTQKANADQAKSQAEVEKVEKSNQGKMANTLLQAQLKRADQPQ